MLPGRVTKLAKEVAEAFTGQKFLARSSAALRKTE